MVHGPERGVQSGGAVLGELQRSRARAVYAEIPEAKGLAVGRAGLAGNQDPAPVKPEFGAVGDNVGRGSGRASEVDIHGAAALDEPADVPVGVLQIERSQTVFERPVDASRSDRLVEDDIIAVGVEVGVAGIGKRQAGDVRRAAVRPLEAAVLELEAAGTAVAEVAQAGEGEVAAGDPG